MYLRKVTEKTFELLQAGCHPSRVFHEQGIEVDHRIVGELRIGLGGIATWEGAEEGIDKDNCYL